jgi:hypothetical protein
MSLIQDALKRKQEEIPPEAAPPLQEPLPVPENKTKAPQSILIMLIVVLIIALLIALGGLAFSLIRSAITSRPAEANDPVAVETMPQEVPAEPVVTEPPEVQPPETPPAETAEVENEIPVLAVGPQWPELKLDGIAQTGSRRLAILNGKMVPAGRNIEEISVLEVTDTSVTVEYRGERRILYINE